MVRLRADKWSGVEKMPEQQPVHHAIIVDVWCSSIGLPAGVVRLFGGYSGKAIFPFTCHTQELTLNLQTQILAPKPRT